MGLFIKYQEGKKSYFLLTFLLIVFCGLTLLENNDASKTCLGTWEESPSEFLNPETCGEFDILEFSTFLGGTGDEQGTLASLHYLGDIVVDSEGNIIVVGRTSSTDFPVLNAYQDTLAGNIDVTVSKFSPNGTLLFSTYLGGSAHDWANCVTLDSSDNIIIGGVTGSTDFPVKDPYQGTCMGGTESNADCFITKLAKNGQSLIFSTYFGHTGSDWCYSICVNSANQIAITGTTYSTNLPLLNPYQAIHRGSLESFVTLFAADGQSLVFSTFLGSSGWDTGRGVVFDSNGDLLVTGQMASVDITTPGVFQQNFGGGSSDAFLAKFKNNGTLLYFSFLGGSEFDRANDIHIDSENYIVITGYTYSDNFPTENAYQDFRVASEEIFVTKVNNSGTNLIFSSYIGGSHMDEGFGLTIDDEDNILVTGKTLSADFPSYFDSNCTFSMSDCILIKFDKDGTLLFTTILGGAGEDLGAEIAFCNGNTTVIMGFTKSADLPTCNAYQDTYGGSCDLFVMKVQNTDLVIDQPVLPPTVTSSETPTDDTTFIGFTMVAIPITLLVYLTHRRRKKS